MPRLIRLAAGVLTLAALLATAPAASAADTIGSDLAKSTQGTIFCRASPCVLSQTALPGRPLTAPYDGVIVRWAVPPGCFSGRLRVLRPAGEGVELAGGTPYASRCSSTPTTVSVPVRAGDRIGLEGNGAPAAAQPEASFEEFAGTPPDGATVTGEPAPQRAELLFNATIERDGDGDGWGDESADRCVGSPDQTDTDGDGAGDACEADDDNDGLSDADERGRGTDARNPDTDGDRVPDARDNCGTTYDPYPADLDGDGAGDACDPDDDGDGVADAAEGSGDARIPDVDYDGRLDGADNCPRAPNEDQADADADRRGDVCDDDDDGDRVSDERDNCPRVANPGQEESPVSDDDEGDVCDGDTDNDGASDTREQRIGTDATADRDTDDDGLSDGDELDASTEPLRRDTDRDGLTDGLEAGRRKPVADPPGAVAGTSARRFRPDRDPRSKTDPRRRDSDRDGLGDGREDRDGDGAWDRRETDPRTRDSDYDGIADGRDRRPLRPRRSLEGRSQSRCTFTEQLDYECRVRTLPGFESVALVACACRPSRVSAYLPGGDGRLQRRRKGRRFVFTARERRVVVVPGFNTIRMNNTGRRPVDVYYRIPL